MSSHNRIAWRAVALFAVGAMAIGSTPGCSSRPPAVEIPQYDPQAFADSLLKRFDTDGNQALSKTEAASAPGLIAAWRRYDANQDESIARQELEARAQQWLDRGEGTSSIMCVVRLAGSQIGDVQVTLVPDESVADATKLAKAVSRKERPSHLSIPPELKPEAHRNFSGMNFGLYRVEISHPTMKLVAAAKSNGCDIGPADQASPVVIHVERSK